MSTAPNHHQNKPILFIIMDYGGQYLESEDPNAPLNWKRIPKYRMITFPKSEPPPYSIDLFREGAFLNRSITELIITGLHQDGYEKTRNREDVQELRAWPKVSRTCLHDKGCIDVQRAMLWLLYTKWVNLEVNPPEKPDPNRPFYDIRNGWYRCECSSIHNGQWFGTRCYARLGGEHVMGWALWSRDDQKFVGDA